MTRRLLSGAGTGTPIQRAYVGVLLVLTGAWLMADPLLWTADRSFLAWRASLVQGSGVLAMGAMSVALLLSARLRVLEPWLGGLDKMVRLHKWLGITGGVLSVAHWVATQAPGWLVGAGWLTLPPRVRPGTAATADWLQRQRGLAEGLGEWAFYAVVVLIVLALLPRFPYRLFYKTHRLLAALYLVLVFHAVVLMRPDDWRQPLGWLMAAVMLAGSVAALAQLTRQVGRNRRVVGVVEAIRRHDDVHSLALSVRLTGLWAGHEAGQFAFVSFDRDEGPHPFTITSPWTGDGQLQFLIKELGDYTDTLAARLAVGDLACIEGPYGQFNFSSSRPRQIWIGGGIGITPFIARMRQLALHPDGKTIDLFVSTAAVDEATLARLQSDARAAKVRLHVHVDGTGLPLDAKQIRAAVPQWQASDIWFCGPAAFGRDLRRGFAVWGFAAADFHQELFAFR